MSSHHAKWRICFSYVEHFRRSLVIDLCVVWCIVNCISVISAWFVANTSENWTVVYGGRDVFQLVVQYLTSVNLLFVTDVSYKHVTPSSVYLDIHSSTSKIEGSCFTVTSVLTLKPTCRQNPEVYCWKGNVRAYYCISLFIYAKSVHIAAVMLKGQYFSWSETRYKIIIQLISDSYEILSERITDESYKLPCLLADMLLLIFTYTVK
jgi:hypothetical protein